MLKKFIIIYSELNEFVFAFLILKSKIKAMSLINDMWGSLNNAKILIFYLKKILKVPLNNQDNYNLKLI